MSENFKKIVRYALMGAGAVLVLAVLAVVVAQFVYDPVHPLGSKLELSVTDMGGGTPGLGLGSAKAPTTAFRGAESDDSIRGSAQNSSPEEPDFGNKKIIKNGYLSLYVKSVNEAAENIKNLALALGGFVEDATVSESESGTKTGYVRIRIPADKFEGAMNNLKQLAVTVDNENINSQDVTAEFVDLEAQLKNFRAQEDQYLEIMKKATSVEDILKVSAELGRVRGEIERIEGRLKFFSRQVDMSTISVNLSSDDEVKVFGLKWRPLVVVKKAMKNMLSGLAGYADAMVNVILFLPVLFLWAVTVIAGLVIVWKVGRWVGKRYFK